MSDPTPTREEMMSALFAHMVIHQTNMAMMLLGKVPNPQTGETICDLEAARMFIDQLEMLQIKTKGNLTKEEEALLKQSLMSLQMTFVEAVEKSDKPKQPAEAPQQKSAEPVQQSAAAPKTPEQPSQIQSGGDVESQKRFVKKY